MLAICGIDSDFMRLSVSFTACNQVQSTHVQVVPRRPEQEAKRQLTDCSAGSDRKDSSTLEAEIRNKAKGRQTRLLLPKAASVTRIGIYMSTGVHSDQIRFNAEPNSGPESAQLNTGVVNSAV